MDGKMAFVILMAMSAQTTMAARTTKARQTSVDSSDELSAELTLGSGNEVTNSSWGGRKAPSFCNDAGCCKTKAKSDADRLTCDEFYDPTVGIAFQMVSKWKWTGFAVSSKLFPKRPPTGRLPAEDQQCMSISHSQKTPCPYPGAEAVWGMVLNVGPSSDFWKWFQVCPSGELTGQCTDGFKCAVHLRTPIVNAGGWTYEKWLQAKNAIVAQTGNSQCKINSYSNAYNEFDTNGFDPNAVAGVLIPECLKDRGERPNTWTMCRALNAINPKKRHWPLFAYTTRGRKSSLVIKDYINCFSIRHPIR